MAARVSARAADVRAALMSQTNMLADVQDRASDFMDGLSFIPFAWIV
jgi:hypothetical protein